MHWAQACNVLWAFLGVFLVMQGMDATLPYHKPTPRFNAIVGLIYAALVAFH
jgi:hypothetical protein